MIDEDRDFNCNFNHVTYALDHSDQSDHFELNESILEFRDVKQSA